MNRRKFIKQGALLVPAFGIFVPRLRAFPGRIIIPPPVVAGTPASLPVFDNATSHNGTVNTTSLSYSFTCSSSANRLLIAVVGVFKIAPAVTSISAITYGGVAMTKIPGTPGTMLNDAQGDGVEMYYLIAPATGANTFAVTAAGTFSGGEGLTTALVSFTSVNQSTPVGTLVQAGPTTSTTASVNPGASSSQYVVDGGAFQNSTVNMTTHSGRTSVANTAAVASLGCSRQSGPSSVMDWTFGSAAWVLCSTTIQGL